MLPAAGEEAGGPTNLAFAGRRGVFDFDSAGPADGTRHLRQREAAFFERFEVFGVAADDGVDVGLGLGGEQVPAVPGIVLDEERLAVVVRGGVFGRRRRDVGDEHAPREADLGRGETDAGRVSHERDHPLGNGGGGGARFRGDLGALPEHLGGVMDDAKRRGIDVVDGGRMRGDRALIGHSSKCTGGAGGEARAEGREEDGDAEPCGAGGVAPGSGQPYSVWLPAREAVDRPFDERSGRRKEPALPLFGRKKGKDESEDAQAPQTGAAGGDGTGADGSFAGGGIDDGDAGTGEFERNPEKARKFFEHARAMHDTTNFEYAMTLWLQGMRWDPTDLSALEKFYDSSLNFMAGGKSKGATKEQLKQFSGKTPMDRYLVNLLQWGAKPIDWQPGMKAMEQAAKLGLVEQVVWIGEQVFPAVQNDPKAKKETLIKLMELFAQAGDFEHAQRAGDAAMAIDPSDGKLAAYVKNISAQATMTRGGFEGGVQAGHFRRNIKNSEKQRELEEEESLSKTDETFERLITRAKTRLRENPDDQDALGKLARLLLERGGEQDEKNAYQLLMKAHQRFNVYRWKQQAGDIQMRVARRKLAELREAAKAAPDDSEKQAKYEAGRKKVLELELEQYRERVRNYPTDLKLKFELGRRLFEAGEYEAAISELQKAKGATGIGSQARGYLARAFLQLGWTAEAEDTYREAIASHAAGGDHVGLDLRYGLMRTLKRRAEESGELDAAKEASELAGKIAMEQFDYRNIKEEREQLQGLVKRLRDGAGAS